MDEKLFKNDVILQKDAENEIIKIKSYIKPFEFFSLIFTGLLGIKISYAINYTHTPHFRGLVWVTIIGTIYYLLTGIGPKNVIIYQSQGKLIAKVEDKKNKKIEGEILQVIFLKGLFPFHHSLFFFNLSLMALIQESKKKAPSLWILVLPLALVIDIYFSLLRYIFFVIILPLINFRLFTQEKCFIILIREDCMRPYNTLDRHIYSYITTYDKKRLLVLLKSFEIPIKEV